MKKLFLFEVFPFSWIKKSLGNLPAHNNLSYFWNFGSFLGIILMLQISTGFLVSMNYVSDISLAFQSLIFITRDSFFGFILRWMHLNGASLFFFLAYAHIFRGLFMSSFRLFSPWMTGTTILLLLMASAFLGYVLPWGQMSLWGATVITNLVSTVPIIGGKLVVWIWGGFSVGNATLGLFYSAHFLLPLVIAVMVIFHIIVLHETGSSSKLSLHTGENKIKFNSAFVIKDMVNLVFVFGFLFFIFLMPYKMGDPENFILANPLSSPLHIQPEWYFLFAYAILRSIPNKLGGVVALVLSVVLLYSFPFFSTEKKTMLVHHIFLVWSFFFVSLVLTWIGGNPVEPPYIWIGQLFTMLYFFLMYLIITLCISMFSLLGSYPKGYTHMPHLGPISWLVAGVLLLGFMLFTMSLLMPKKIKTAISSFSLDKKSSYKLLW